MTLHDLYLLSPELSMVGLAIAIIVLDLLVDRKKLLHIFTIIGLIVPLSFTLSLWLAIQNDSMFSNTGIFGTLVVDQFSLFFKFLIIGVAAVIVFISVDYATKFKHYQGEYYALMLFSSTGMMLLASTVELITMYISLELTALPIAALSAFLGTRNSTEAGMKFLILSAISSAVLLYGMVMVYGFTGSTMLQDLANQIDSHYIGFDGSGDNYALLFGIALIIAGFGFKIASVPFHMWAPDVYEGSPTPVTAFLSVASKAAGFAVILRVFYVAFSQEVLSLDWSIIFAIMSVLSMTIGNLIAIRQNNIKRLLAYSTVAHAGYILVGMAAVSVRSGSDLYGGASGVLFYLVGYGLSNLTAFSAIIAVSNNTHSDDINSFAGIGRRAPYLAVVLTLAMVSLIGLPPAVGFISKIYIFGAAVNANLEWLVLFGVVNSVISAYYYLRIVKVMYLNPSDSNETLHVGISLRIGVTVMFVSMILFGLYPTPLINFAKNAALAIM